MKELMLGVTFVLTVCIVIGGMLVYPHIIGQVVPFNNKYVFSFFLAKLLTLLILC